MCTNKVALIASVLLVVVAPLMSAVPLKALPISLQSTLGAQKNMGVIVPEGASSITADTINNLAIVFADTVYIMSDGSVVPENPSTTVPPFTSIPTVPTGGITGSPIITPPTFPGRK